ncbi:hypothetical protein KC365_g3962 [Hortaea werneckii]|nr:hypothetical protein KC339_g9199 [Hortaea werneckii]KAI7239861.1 hypothetical protein KC365_g3962 [Hortaea werneckii]
MADNRPVEATVDPSAIAADNHSSPWNGGLPAITANNRSVYGGEDVLANTADNHAFPAGDDLSFSAANDQSAQTFVSAFDGAGDVKTTRASALSGASCRVPVKPQRKAKKKASLPPAHLQNETLIYGNGDDAFPIDPAIAMTGAAMAPTNNPSEAGDPEDTISNQQNGTSGTSSRSANPFGRGANRTRNAWNPFEKSPQKTLEEYQVPELSRGSCVSYAEDPKAQRQVGKARNGEFKEEAVVWGVRFLVV